MKDLFGTHYEPLFDHLGGKPHFAGSIIDTHGRVVATVECERVAKMLALAPKLAAALHGLLCHTGAYFPMGMTKPEEKALNYAQKVYSKLMSGETHESSSDAATVLPALGGSTGGRPCATDGGQG